LVSFIPPWDPFFILLALCRAKSWSVSYRLTLPANSSVTIQFGPQPNTYFIVGGFVWGTPRDLAGNPIESMDVYMTTEHVQARATIVYALESQYREGAPAWLDLSEASPLVITIVNSEPFTVTWSMTLYLGVLNEAQHRDMVQLWTGMYNHLWIMGLPQLPLIAKGRAEALMREMGLTEE